MEKTDKNEKIEFINRTRQRVIQHLTLNKAVRNAVLLDYLISKEKLTKDEKNDASPNGKKNQLRSRLGTVLASMVNDKILSYSNGFFTLIKEKPVAIKEEEIKPEIFSLLKDNSTLTKRRFFPNSKYALKPTSQKRESTTTTFATLRGGC